MRRLLLGLAVLPLFVVSPILGVVGLALFSLAHIPYLIAWVLRRTADGVDLVGDGVMAGASVVYKGQDKVVAYREGLIVAYRDVTATSLAEKQARYAAAKAEEAACQAQAQAACG